MKLIIDIPNEEYERVIAGKWEGNPLADYIENGEPYEERPQGECIPVKDLINFIHTCREELFEKMKDYHQKEFEIRDSMLTNFEQIVKLASSKYKADMRGGRE